MNNDYPRVLYHADHGAVIVADAECHAALSDAWGGPPASAISVAPPVIGYAEALALAPAELKPEPEPEPEPAAEPAPKRSHHKAK